MRLDLAMGLNVGDTVYNCFLDRLTIISKSEHLAEDGFIESILFITQDNNVYSYKKNYIYEDLYLANLEEESDEEVAWIKWAQENQEWLRNEFDHSILKECYMQAFAVGYHHKRKFSAAEHLQK